MKRWLALGLMVLVLTGCSGKNEALDSTMALRAKLLGGSGCQFDAVITADYGDKLQEFTLHCQADHQGNVVFQVDKPESIAGITGRLSAKGGEVTFDNQALAFPLLADGQISPASVPWIFVKTLTGGYVTACGMDGELIRATIRDSYDSDALTVDIWLEGNQLPVQAEIAYQDRKIMTVGIENFQIL